MRLEMKSKVIVQISSQELDLFEFQLGSPKRLFRAGPEKKLISPDE